MGLKKHKLNIKNPERIQELKNDLLEKWSKAGHPILSWSIYAEEPKRQHVLWHSEASCIMRFRTYKLQAPNEWANCRVEMKRVEGDIVDADGNAVDTSADQWGFRCLLLAKPPAAETEGNHWINTDKALVEALNGKDINGKYGLRIRRMSRPSVTVSFQGKEHALPVEQDVASIYDLTPEVVMPVVDRIIRTKFGKQAEGENDPEARQWAHMDDMKNTIPLMISSDRKERLAAEYRQAEIRRDDLCGMMNRFFAGTLGYRPKSEIEKYRQLLRHMSDYMEALESIANDEGIDLTV